MKKMASQYILVSFALALLGQARPAGKTSIAVYPIKAVGAVDKSLAATMTSLLNNDLVQSSRLIVIKESMLQEVMKRQAMNISDLCDDTICQVEIGKLVQAQKMVVGELSKLGSLTILTLELIDIQSGASEFSAREQCACAEEQLIALTAVAAAKIRNYFGEAVPIPALSAASSPQAPLVAPNQPSREDAINTYLRNADQFYREGKYQYALVEYQKVLILDPNHLFAQAQVNALRQAVPAATPFSGQPLQAKGGPMVYVSDFKFYIDKYEVTNQDYQECVSAGVCKETKKERGFDAPNQPVVYVDQNDARTYCRGRGSACPKSWNGKKRRKGPMAASTPGAIKSRIAI
jgi:hypothetical protein